MSKDLEHYRLLPYERVWSMREDAGERYYVVRLVDLPAVAGDGATLSAAVEDLREAFDEFIVAWLDAGRRIPEPRRGFTIPSSVGQRLAKESSETGCLDRMKGERESSWADTVKLYTGDIVVRDSADEPLLTEELATAVG